jgi:hypothetical protein
MAQLKVHLRAGQPPALVSTEAALLDVLDQADKDANARGMLNVIEIVAPNGNDLSLVVGGEETVLGFTASNGPPYYASRGKSADARPTLICFVQWKSREEFPRHAVVPRASGVAAAKEFFNSSALPSCVQWQEV